MCIFYNSFKTFVKICRIVCLPLIHLKIIQTYTFFYIYLFKNFQKFYLFKIRLKTDILSTHLLKSSFLKIDILSISSFQTHSLFLNFEQIPLFNHLFIFFLLKNCLFPFQSNQLIQVFIIKITHFTYPSKQKCHFYTNLFLHMV